MSKRKKTQHRTGQIDQERLKHDLAAQGLPENIKIIQRRPGESKISTVLLEFIEPYREAATTKLALEKLIAVGICAWNASLMPKDARHNYIGEVIQSIVKQSDEELGKELADILTTLLIRKKQFFAEDTRYILSYQLTDTGSGYSLTMVSQAELAQ